MTLDEARSGIATALQGLKAAIPELQVYGYWKGEPTPPALDIYQGTPFLDGAGFGVPSLQAYFTVRARVAMDDEVAGQQLLYRLLDPTDEASVEAAIHNADVGAVVPEGVSGLEQYAEDSYASQRMLGCTWRVRAFL